MKPVEAAFVLNGLNPAKRVFHLNLDAEELKGLKFQSRKAGISPEIPIFRELKTLFAFLRITKSSKRGQVQQTLIKVILIFE